MCNTVKDAIKNDKLPLHNLIGIGVDVTYSMVGSHNSVSKHLKDSVPHLVKCICHSPPGSWQATDALPRHLDFVVWEVHSWFAHSTQRQLEYSTLYSAINNECPLKLTRSCEINCMFQADNADPTKLTRD
ncbi:UNVERIFIED_CONTAM: hypothetical protein FKN15_058355 [Acipenser sinensis]